MAFKKKNFKIYYDFVLNDAKTYHLLNTHRKLINMRHISKIQTDESRYYFSWSYNSKKNHVVHFQLGTNICIGPSLIILMPSLNEVISTGF